MPKNEVLWALALFRDMPRELGVVVGLLILLSPKLLSRLPALPPKDYTEEAAAKDRFIMPPLSPYFPQNAARVMFFMTAAYVFEVLGWHPVGAMFVIFSGVFIGLITSEELELRRQNRGFAKSV